MASLGRDVAAYSRQEGGSEAGAVAPTNAAMLMTVETSGKEEPVPVKRQLPLPEEES